MCNTYYSGSRSYFRAAADKIEEIGSPVKADELSVELQLHFNWSEDEIQYWRAFTTSPEDMRACFPDDAALREFCGYVYKNTLFSYQTGEIDDIADKGEVKLVTLHDMYR